VKRRHDLRTWQGRSNDRLERLDAIRERLAEIAVELQTCSLERARELRAETRRLGAQTDAIDAERNADNWQDDLPWWLRLWRAA
jgi:DNA repair exonuclease SbcCD ATPase subunit